MIYFFDGTKNGFLTAFSRAFLDGDAQLTSTLAQLCIGQRLVCVETDNCHAKRVENRLLSFDRDCMHDLEHLLRSSMENHEQIAFRYFRTFAMQKRPVGKQP